MRGRFDSGNRPEKTAHWLIENYFILLVNALTALQIPARNPNRFKDDRSLRRTIVLYLYLVDVCCQV